MEHLTGQRGEQILSLVALAATANTVLLLLVSGSRSIYGMASSGVLPAVFARVGATQIPSAAAGFVLAVASLLVFTGSLSQVAELTNGAILTSFMLVNLSLVWISIRHRPSPTGARPVLDGIVGVVAFGLCGWLFLHTGVAALVLASALAGVGALVGRRTVKAPRVPRNSAGPGDLEG
jgi:basic amino acid/polyamine antiporter, APA family